SAPLPLIISRPPHLPPALSNDADACEGPTASPIPSASVPLSRCATTSSTYSGGGVRGKTSLAAALVPALEHVSPLASRAQVPLAGFFGSTRGTRSTGPIMLGRGVAATRSVGCKGRTSSLRKA